MVIKLNPTKAPHTIQMNCVRISLRIWPKRHVRGSELSIPYPRARLSYTMLICLIFCVFGINPAPQVIDKLFKELILFTAKAALAWLIFNELLNL